MEGLPIKIINGIKLFSIYYMHLLSKNSNSQGWAENSENFLKLTDRLRLKKNQLKENKFHQLLPLTKQIAINQKNTDRYFNSTQQRYKYRMKDKRSENFHFLEVNSDIMNRTINHLTIRSKERFTNYNRTALDKISISQIKLDKNRKEEWITAHNRIHVNTAKFADVQERKVYRSRKKYLQNSVQTFFTKDIQTFCYDGIFPGSRLSAIMISLVEKNELKNRLFLVGGLSSEMSTRLHFHEYQFENDLWLQIKSDTPYSPQFNLSQHVVLTYQKSIYVVGGIAVIPSATENKNQRYSIPFISCYNAKTRKWSRINWNVYLRAHAGASLGYYGIIDGGITEENKNNAKTYLFDMMKPQAPIHVSSNGLRLSHHKIISTDAFEDKNKNYLKFQGLICFGGKKQDGDLNENLFFLNYDSKFSDISDKFGKFQWSLLSTAGKSPCARYMHTMDLLETKSNIFERKVYCAVLGGIDKNESILSDFWLLDLVSLDWCQIYLSSSVNQILSNGIAGHCCAAIKNQLYIFGGYNTQRQFISKFWSINCQNGLKICKNNNSIKKQQQQQQ